MPDFFAHDTAIIDKGAIIGSGTRIWHWVHICSGAVIGSRCNIGQNVFIADGVKIGSNCKIQNNVSIYTGVILENGVFCGPSMVFTNIYNPRATIPKMNQVRNTLAKEGTTIGANATIICGVTLGKYCFVGAGALINTDVPDYALMVGNPARQIGWTCKCGEKLSNDFICPICGKRYLKSDKGLLDE